MSLRPIKRLGQHFLVDPNTIRRIIDQLGAPEDARVVEIGPGTGALTAPLLERYQDVSVIEVDERSVELLRATHSRLNVYHMDVLDVDYSALAADGSSQLWIIGNLPYNITSQILFGLLETDVVARSVLTIQKEVAERIVAKPRTKPYGILSVLVQLMVQPEICFHLSPHVFRPKPDVWSSTIRLTWPAASPLPPDVGFDAVRRVVRSAFNQRRKTLRNSLGALAGASGVDVPEQWARKRAEELEPAEYVELSRILVDSGS